MASWVLKPWLEDFLLNEEHSVEVTASRKCQIVQTIDAPDYEREGKSCALVSDKQLFIKAVFTQDSIEDYCRRFHGSSLEDLKGANISLNKYSIIPKLDCDQNQCEFELHIFGFDSPGGSKSIPFGGTIAHASKHDPIEAKLRCLWREKQIRKLSHIKFANGARRLKCFCKNIGSEDEELLEEIPEWRPEFVPPSSLETDQSESASVDQQSLHQSNSISAALANSANISSEPAEGMMGEAFSVPTTEKQQHSLIPSNDQQNLPNPSCKEDSQRRICSSPENSFEDNSPLPGAAILDFVSAKEAENIARNVFDYQPAALAVEQASENQIKSGRLSPCFNIIHKKSDAEKSNTSANTSSIADSTKKLERLYKETNFDGEDLLDKRSGEHVANSFASSKNSFDKEDVIPRSDLCTATVNQNQEVQGKSSGDIIEQRPKDARAKFSAEETLLKGALPKETYTQYNATQGSKKRPVNECDEFVKSKKRKIELVKEVTTGEADAEYHYIEQSQGFAIDKSKIETFGLRMPKALKDFTSKTSARLIEASCNESVTNATKSVNIKESNKGDKQENNSMVIDVSCNETMADNTDAAITKGSNKGNKQENNCMSMDAAHNVAMLNTSHTGIIKENTPENDFMMVDASRNETITGTKAQEIIKESDQACTPKNNAILIDASGSVAIMDSTSAEMTKEREKGDSPLESNGSFSISQSQDAEVTDHERGKKESKERKKGENSYESNASFSVSQSQDFEMADHQSETPEECKRGAESFKQSLPGLLSSILTTDRVFGGASHHEGASILDFAKVTFRAPKIPKRARPRISKENGVVDSKRDKVMEDQEGESTSSSNDQIKNTDEKSAENVVSDSCKDVSENTTGTSSGEHAFSEQIPDKTAHETESQKAENQREKNAELNNEADSQNVSKVAITGNEARGARQEKNNPLNDRENLTLAPEHCNVGKDTCLGEGRQDIFRAAQNSGGREQQTLHDLPGSEESGFRGESGEKLTENSENLSNISHDNVNQENGIITKNQLISNAVELVPVDAFRIDLSIVDGKMNLRAEHEGQNSVAKKSAVDLNMNIEHTARDTKPGNEQISKGADLDIITAELKDKASDSMDCTVELQINTESGTPGFETAIQLNPVVELPNQYTVVQEDVTIVMSKPCESELQEISSVTELIECMAYSPKQTTQEHHTLSSLQEQEHLSQDPREQFQYSQSQMAPDPSILPPRQPPFQATDQRKQADESHSTPSLTQLAACLDNSRLTQSTQVSQPDPKLQEEVKSVYIDLEAIVQASDRSHKNINAKGDYTRGKITVRPVEAIPNMATKENCTTGEIPLGPVKKKDSSSLSCTSSSRAKSASESILKPSDYDKVGISCSKTQGDLSETSPSATQLANCLVVSQNKLDSQRTKIVADDTVHRCMSATGRDSSHAFNSQNTPSATQLANYLLVSQSDPNSQRTKVVTDDIVHRGMNVNESKASQVSKAQSTHSDSELASALVGQASADSQLKSVTDYGKVSSESTFVNQNFEKHIIHDKATQGENQANEIKKTSKENLARTVACNKSIFRPPMPKDQGPPNTQGTQGIPSLTQLADCLVQSQIAAVSHLTGPAKKEKFVLSQNGTQSVYVDLEAIVKRASTRNKERKNRGKGLRDIKENRERERVGEQEVETKDLKTFDKEMTINDKQSICAFTEKNLLYVDDTSKRGDICTSEESNQNQQKASFNENKTVVKENGNADLSINKSLTPISLSSIEADDVIGLSKTGSDSSRNKTSDSSYEESLSIFKASSQQASSGEISGGLYPVLKLSSSSSTSSSDGPDKNHQPTPSRLLDQVHLRKSTQMQNEEPHIPFQVTAVEICDSQSQSQGTEYFSAAESLDLDDQSTSSKRRREPEDIEIDTVPRKISETPNLPSFSPIKTRKKETLVSFRDIRTWTSKDKSSKTANHNHKDTDKAEQINQKPTNKSSYFYFNPKENKLAWTSTAKEAGRKQKLEGNWPSEEVQKSILNFWRKTKTEQKVPGDSLSIFKRFHPKHFDG